LMRDWHGGSKGYTGIPEYETIKLK
jgi:hypothetical protein